MIYVLVLLFRKSAPKEEVITDVFLSFSLVNFKGSFGRNSRKQLIIDGCPVIGTRYGNVR